MKNAMPKRLVIIGGGAGGLELAAMVSRKHGKHISLTLVDANLKHVWKPLLHEVATGTLITHENELDYIPYAKRMGFQFVYGKLASLQRAKKEITIAAIPSASGAEFIPERVIAYDILVLAIGSLSDDFAIPGVKAHCLFLDNLAQAETMQHILINNIIRQVQITTTPLQVAIVGAGATGVELAAEMHYAIHEANSYSQMQNETKISLIEAQSRIVPQLPERTSETLTAKLAKLGIEVITNEQVSEVTAEAVLTRNRKILPAKIIVWAAGIKANAVLASLDNLEVNRANQLLVNASLQTTLDPAIFAIGDCAACLAADKQHTIPPTAQAAHQQAIFINKILAAYLQNKPLVHFQYHDYGSLVTLSHYKIVGNLMGKFSTNIHIEGLLARFLYFSIHKKHQIALHGYWHVFWQTLTNLLSGRNRTRLKLH